MLRGLAGMMAASARAAAATTSASASASATAPSRARAVATRCHTTSVASHHHRRRLPRAGAPSRHPRPLQPSTPARRHAYLAAASTTDEADTSPPSASAPSASAPSASAPSSAALSSSPSPYAPQPPDYAGAGASIPSDPTLPPGHIILVDGMSLIFRSFYGWRNRASEPMLDSSGRDVGVLYSVAHAILAVVELHPTHLAVCFDAKGKTFRHEMFADYKANRPPTPPEIVAVIPEVIEMVRRMGVPSLSASGVEADDVIGTVSRRAVERGLHVSIVSPDKDFFQLLGPRVRQLRPNGKNYDAARAAAAAAAGGEDGFGPVGHRNLTGKGLVPYTEADFREEFDGLDPAQFVDMLAMIGDSSDNIPGVEGIGPKTAPRLLRAYGNIEGAVAHAADVKSKRARESLASERGAATAYLCRSLVKIRTELSAPTLNDPTLPMEALALTGRIPPADGGAAVGEYLERELELPSAAERWREICYAVSRAG